MTRISHNLTSGLKLASTALLVLILIRGIPINEESLLLIIVKARSITNRIKTVKWKVRLDFLISTESFQRI
jgi:hypothetical protein